MHTLPSCTAAKVELWRQVVERLRVEKPKTITTKFKHLILFLWKAEDKQHVNFTFDTILALLRT